MNAPYMPIKTQSNSAKSHPDFLKKPLDVRVSLKRIIKLVVIKKSQNDLFTYIPKEWG